MTPTISVLVPARDEALDIAGCIRAIAASDLSKDDYEVLLIDGVSTDGTDEIAAATAQAAGLSFRIVDNPDRHVAAALNRGAAMASGELLVRVDARARIGRHHLDLCRSLLSGRPDVGVVGGGQAPEPRPGAPWQERSIARSLANRYTTGLAHYRRSRRPRETDTVWMGAFRRSDVLAAGGWPDWPRQNQDFRLNEALRDRGLRVWFDPRLDAAYLVRRSFEELARQYYRFGRAKGSLWRSGRAWSGRHAVVVMAPLLASAVLATSVRKLGVVPSVTGIVAAMLVVDHLGVSAPAPWTERLGAVIGTVVSDGCWAVGVLVGVAR